MTHHDDDNVVENEIEQLFDDSDPNTWIASGEMESLTTSIFKRNSLSQTLRKSILQSEPRNKNISFEPPVMDKKIWTAMSRYARENDKLLRRMAYRFSSVIRPIDNTLRMVYATKPEDQTSESYNAWLLLEQTVLNTRMLALDALSFANELRQEQALKATISPTYHKPPEKEEVFGDELHATIKNENDTNKLLNDAAWQRKRASQSKNQKYSNTNLNFKNNNNKSSSYSKSKFNKGSNKKFSGYSGNGSQAGQPANQSHQQN